MPTPALAPVPQGVDPAVWLAACAAVRGYCGWHVAPAVTETVTVDGPGGDLLRLPSAHVTAVLSVVSDGEAVADPQWSRHGMIRAECGRWSNRFGGVVVELTHGFDECPADVLEVVRMMVAQGAAAAASGGGMASMLTNGPFMMQVSSAAQAGALGLSAQHRAVLSRYKLGPVPG